jgi:hypothetical protein
VGTDLTESAGVAVAPTPDIPTPRGLAWPSAGALRTYLAWGISWEIVFCLVYFGCNWLTAQRSVRFHLYFPWELRVPFVPWMIWAYLSVFVLYVLPLFQMDQTAMRRLGKQMLVGTIASGCVFLLLPAELGFPRTEDAGSYAHVYDALYAIALPHNLVPSLHIVLTTLVSLALMDSGVRVLRFVYATWLSAIIVSVVLVHQHHVVDVASGLVLAGLCRRFVLGSPEAGRYARVPVD